MQIFHKNLMVPSTFFRPKANIKLGNDFHTKHLNEPCVAIVLIELSYLPNE